MFEILLLPALAGFSVALASGPLGAFTVWRRMAYFGDTLAHSALMGVAIALMLDVNTQAGILFSCLFIAVLLASAQKKSKLSADSLLGIFSHTSLALGLVLVSFFSGSNIDIYAYLFGDLLTVTRSEVISISAVSIFTLGLLTYFWRPLLLICIDEDLAQAEGKPVQFLRVLLMCLMALVIAIAMKIVGILLITAMLIIPAAASRKITRSPEAMAIVAIFIGMLSIVCGLMLSAFFDTPAGPSIVLGASGLFVVSYFSSLR